MNRGGYRTTEVDCAGRKVMLKRILCMFVIEVMSLTSLTGAQVKAGEPEESVFVKTAEGSGLSGYAPDLLCSGGSGKYYADADTGTGRGADRVQGEQKQRRKTAVRYRIRRGPKVRGICRMCSRKGKKYVPGFFFVGRGEKTVCKFILKKRHI